MADKIITVRPAAGPLTLRLEPLSQDTTTPPTMPLMTPPSNGAPEASEMPQTQRQGHQEHHQTRQRVLR